MNPSSDHRSEVSLKSDYSHMTIEELEVAVAADVARKELEQARQQYATQMDQIPPVVQPEVANNFLASFKSRITQHPHWLQALAFAGAGAMLLLVVSALFVPQKITVSFSKTENCVLSPALFPATYKSTPQNSFKLQRPASVSVGRVALFSNKLCATPSATPFAHKKYMNQQLFSLSMLHIGKNVAVTTGDYLKIKTASINKDSKIPLLKPVEFKLDATDQTFVYALTANNQTATCTKHQQILSCNLQDLKLAYGSQYEMTLVRQFGTQAPSAVTTEKVQTITATAITQTSIGSNSTVYDKPHEISLQTNKTLTKVEGVSLTAVSGDKTTNIPTKSSFKDSTITISIPDDLPRNAKITAHIKNVTAADNSQLEQAYDLPFTTSGGPKATSINLASSGVGFRPTMAITFDQTLLANQDPAALVTVSSNKLAQAATYTISGNKLIIHPKADFPVCARLTIQTNNSAQSQYGVAGDSARQFNARVQCFTTYSIGTSVRGRPITAYQFGSGDSMILYVGAMHGNEQNAMRVLQKWINELNARPDDIPSGRSIVIIPSSNPDGVAANMRQNAHTIDLNRNFPTYNWQTKVTVPGGGGAQTDQGGPSPLSEPESQALAAFVQAKRPRLMLTYHSHAGIVEANEGGDSEALGNTYGAKSGYKAIPTRAIGNTFDYSTTGAFEDWMNDKLGLPALCIELRSPTADEFSLNRNAMWAMAQLPVR